MLLNSSADWGKSDPLNVPKTAVYLESRGAKVEDIQRLVWDNPMAFYGSQRMNLPDALGAVPADADSRTHSSIRPELAKK